MDTPPALSVVATMSAEVYARTTFEGIHCWPEAPAAVIFLRTPHRHIFHVTAYKTVTHSDRDVEFIMLGRAVKRVLANCLIIDKATGVYDLGRMSCEQIALLLIGELSLSRCEVSEDNENGVIVHG